MGCAVKDLDLVCDACYNKNRIIKENFSMKLSKWISTFLAVSIGLAALPVFPVHGAETDGMIDSGINYPEATETIKIGRAHV